MSIEYPPDVLIARAVLAGAKWVGTNSKEWDLLRWVAEQSQIEGLVEQLDAVKAKNDANRLLHAGDPW